MVYQFKQGSFISGNISAQTAGEVCEKLERENRLSAKELLDVSRPADAPLHDAFEWRDDVAAEQFREQQARHIINCICVVDEAKTAEPVRAFFNIVRTEQQYQHIETILRSENDTQLLLQQALKELEAFKKKYAQLEQLAEVFRAIEEIKNPSAA